MTPRSSVRAQAREIYQEMAVGQAAATPTADNIATPTPDPSPQEPATGRAAPAARPGGGGEKGAAPNLTACVRALYEDSAVPVREIAVLVGVTERTIYKYACKHRWTPRYRWMPDGSRPAGKKARSAPGYAAVKGAGGRFIRREDYGTPFAEGLKATDPAAAKRAAAACREALRLARAAQTRAETAQRLENRMRIIAAVRRASGELAAYRAARPAPANDPIERALGRALDVATHQWEALLAEEERMGRASAVSPRSP